MFAADDQVKVRTNKKARPISRSGLFNLNPAASYSFIRRPYSTIGAGRFKVCLQAPSVFTLVDINHKPDFIFISVRHLWLVSVKVAFRLDRSLSIMRSRHHFPTTGMSLTLTTSLALAKILVTHRSIMQSVHDPSPLRSRNH